MMAVALAIDIGTSSVRASLWTERGLRAGEIVARPTSLRVTADGAAEFDAEDLLRAVEDALDSLLAGAGVLACEIVAVGTSCFWHSLVGIDDAGHTVTTVTTWADTRARSVAARLRASTDAEAFHARTGAELHASYPVVRLAWLAGKDALACRSVVTWLSFPDYLRMRFFGAVSTGASMASGSGLFNPNANDWDEAALELSGITRSQLPEVVDAPAVGLTGQYARRWPAIALVPWFPAIGDGACATIGSGCVGPDRMALSLGTSGALRIVVEARNVDVHDGLFAYRIDARRWVIGGALSEGGAVVRWLATTVGLELDSDLDARLDDMPADGHGLTILPFPSGERSPGWADNARLTITGLTLGTSPVAILRAALESVAFRFQLIADRLREVAPEAAEIVGSGGALVASPAWCRILADVLGRPLVVPDCAESSSRGAALLAIEATDEGFALADVAPLPATVVIPDASRRDVYRAAGLRQQKLYEAIISR